MRHAELKQRVNAEIDRRSGAFDRHRGRHLSPPGTGLQGDAHGRHRRHASSSGWASAITSNWRLTGLKTVVSGAGGGGPTVAVMGELDSVLVADHPSSPTRRLARRTVAATTRRSRLCWASPTACSARACYPNWPATWPSSPCRPRSMSRSTFARAARRGPDRVHRRQGRTGAARRVRRYRHGHDGARSRRDGRHRLMNTPATASSASRRASSAKRPMPAARRTVASTHSTPRNSALDAINAQRETFRDDDTVRVIPS